MFSGIVEAKVIATSLKRDGDSIRISLPIPKDWKLEEGESINVDGICSTVEKTENGNFFIYYMPETLRKTNLSKVDDDHNFNLEKSLTLNSLISGHLVSGHVDITAQVESIRKEQDAKVLNFNISKEFTKYIIYKGSICVNGTSLTVIEVNDNSFSVSLIPYTLEHTNLGDLKIGDVVNIEVDLIAKYLEKISSKV